MTNDKVTIKSSYPFISPERSGWECQLFGCGKSLSFTPEIGNEPNMFWRLMQYICFGNKWINTKEKK